MQTRCRRVKTRGRPDADRVQAAADRRPQVRGSCCLLHLSYTTPHTSNPLCPSAMQPAPIMSSSCFAAPVDHTCFSGCQGHLTLLLPAQHVVCCMSQVRVCAVQPVPADHPRLPLPLCTRRERAGGISCLWSSCCCSFKVCPVSGSASVLPGPRPPIGPPQPPPGAVLARCEPDIGAAVASRQAGSQSVHTLHRLACCTSAATPGLPGQPSAAWRWGSPDPACCRSRPLPAPQPCPAPAQQQRGCAA